MPTQQFEQLNTIVKEEEAYKINLSEFQKKIDSIEEVYYALNEMDRETYETSNQRYQEEKGEILQNINP